MKNLSRFFPLSLVSERFIIRKIIKTITLGAEMTDTPKAVKYFLKEKC
jgi:hypothetical protein